jgi:heme-degrading monooxygenase HmoA
MIVRVWRGRTTIDKAGPYQAHLTTTVFPKLEAMAGYLGGRVLSRVTDGRVGFMVVTEWASWDAIRAFAGSDPERAAIEQEARALLEQADEHVEHFDVTRDSLGRQPGVRR